MKLEELKNYSKLDGLMYLERFVCQKFHHAFANYSEVSKEFQPQNVYKPFSLPLVNKNIGKITSWGNNQTLNSLLETGFPVHPDTFFDLKKFNLEKVGELPVLPTCSTRTLLVEYDSNPCFLKTHLERYISRTKRIIEYEAIEKNIHISDIIRKGFAKNEISKDFGFLLDIGGAALSLGDKHVGVIIRKTEPFPEIPQSRHLVPVFSLYSKDKHNIDDSPLLIQLIDRAKADPFDYVIENIAVPLMKHFNFFAREMDILLQPHAQNTLLELDENFSVIRIIHRDVPSRTIKTEFGKERWPSYIEYSMMYDNYLCRDSLKLIGDLISSYYNIGNGKFTESIKERFQSIITIKDRFPNEEYTLPERLMERSEPVILNRKALYR